MLKTSDFAAKDVVSISDGRKLGAITDVEFDVATGKLTAIVVPGNCGRFLGFLSRGEDVVIPWERIRKIGKDVILVEIVKTPELED